MLFGVDEDQILRIWSLETIQRKLFNGIEFDMLRRGFGGGADEDGLREPLTSQEADDLAKEYLWASPHAK